MANRLPPGVVPQPVGPGQVSVWTFPRPPVIVADNRRVIVRLGGEIIADTTDSLKALETSHPPTWYLPMSAFRAGSLRLTAGSSVCEFKGPAEYYDVLGGGRTHDSDDPQGYPNAGTTSVADAFGVTAVSPEVVAKKAAWRYPKPWAGFEAIADRVALYVPQMDSVTVDGIDVEPQPGSFYGGWITPDVVGPFKGIPGSMGW